MFQRLRLRPEWQFFAALPRADPVLATAWWVLLLFGGVLPAVFAVATGVMVGAVERGEPLAAPLVLVGATFTAMLVASPIQNAVSMNLGEKMSAWLNEALIRSCVDPPGVGHLEDADLADDLTTAREFDRGMTGPPMYLNVDFIATSLLGVVGGVAVGGGAGRLLLVGAAGAAAGVGLDPLAAARERRLEGPQHR